MMDVSDALKEFFTLRGQYRRDVTRERRRILKRPHLSAKERKTQLLNVKGKCPSCGKSKGIRFSQNGTFLTAVCSSEDCPLEIRIDRGEYIPLNKLLGKALIRRNTLTEDIVSTKLNMMFEFVDEESTIQAFAKLKKEFLAVSKKLRSLRETYKLNNTDDDIILRLRTIETTIAEARVTLTEIIKEQPTDKVNRLVRVLVDVILPASKQLMALKYNVNAISYDDSDKKYKLVQERSSYGDNLILTRKASVLQFIT